MKKYLFTFLASLLFTGLNAQEKKVDTIYVRTNVEDISSKFHSTFENQYKINFFLMLSGNFMGLKELRFLFITNHQKRTE